MKTIVPEIFGKYILLDRIAVGGMAEVFRGKITGDKGFEKLIVIKRMLPQVAKKNEMVSAFIDEAKLVALLQHENIIHVYDFGEIDTFYYIAMEYLFGQDLHSIIKKSYTEGKPIRPEIALMIVSRICDGMGYAHHLKDIHDKPLDIIHRDLTPHNIIITYDGKIKIIDFGIAKAATQSDKTQAGLVKGKMGYMSPEHIDGNHIDHRADIFSIGVMLYEMLTHKRMYQGNGIDLFKKVMDADYEPPEKAEPNLPPELISILHKALATDPDDRYQNCSDLQQDIEDYLYTASGRPGSKHLSQYVTDLFITEHQDDKKAVVRAVEATLSEYDIENGEASSDITNGKTLETGPYDKTATLLNESVSPTGEKASQKAETHFLHQLSGKIIPVFFLLFIAAIVWWGYISFLKYPDQPLIEARNTMEQRTVSGDLDQKSDEELLKQKETDLQIQFLLDKANRLLLEHKLTTPEKENAYEYFSQVLELAPENTPAVEGLVKIGDSYARLAETTWSKSNISQTRDYVSKGLSVIPGHPGLLNLKEKLDVESNRALEEKVKKERFIEDLLDQGYMKLKENKLTIPENGSALYFFNRVLSLDPENKKAEAGLIKISDTYAGFAENAKDASRYKRAGELVEKGLAVVSTHPQLLSIKKELNQQAARALRERNKTIKSHLKKADQRLNEYKLTTPVSDCAYYYYKRALQLDSGNKAAKQGLTKIGDRYVLLAEKAWKEFKINDARFFVDKGLSVVPKHKRLLYLKKEFSRSKPSLILRSVDQSFKDIFQ